MGDVIQFPNDAQRNWAVMESGLRGLLAPQLGESGADWICRDLRPRWDAIQGSLSIHSPPECAPVIKQLQGFMRETIDKCLLQIILLEIELYARVHDQPPPNVTQMLGDVIRFPEPEPR